MNACGPDEGTTPMSRSFLVRILSVCLLAASLTLTVRAEAGAAPAAQAFTPVGWVLESSGRVHELGGAPDLGDAASSSSPAVDLVATRDAKGYWIVRADGTVSAHGSAAHFGDLTGFALNRPAIGLSATPTGKGYIILGQDGGVFAFGDAGFFGSVPGVSPVAAAQTTAVEIQVASAGYRIIHDDGGVFAFGNARFIGSVPGVLTGRPLDRPIVAAVDGGEGAYAMVGGDGGVFAFGMGFHGSIAGVAGTEIVAAAGDRSGGYVLLDADGTVSWFSDSSVVQLSVPVGSRAVAIEVVGTKPVTTGGNTTTTRQLPTTTAPRPTTTKPAPATTVTTAKPKPAPTTTSPTTQPTTTTAGPTTTQAPAPGSVVIWDTQTHNSGPDVYWDPNWNDLGNFRSPNVMAGDALLELEVLAKPTSRPALLQVCAWRFHNGVGFSGGFDETCSQVSIDGMRITDETGKVVVNLGSPDDWWVKGGGTFPWHLGPDVMRILIKDEATKSLFMDSRCGAACYSGPGTAAEHTPIQIRSKLIFNN